MCPGCQSTLPTRAGSASLKVDRMSYTPIFLIAGLMPLVALTLVQLLIPRISMTIAHGPHAKNG